MGNTYESELVEKIQRVGDITSFRLRRPEGYRFQGGQWFVITFPGQDREEPWEHHFSHSDAPTEPWLEFTTRLRGSDFKNALDALPLGSQVELEGPFGSFTLPSEVERAAFLAGGIGITCVRSILRWLCESCAPDAGKIEGAVGPAGRAETALQEAVLFFANRSEDAIPFAADIAEFTEKVPGFRVVHVLSQAGEGWQGRREHLDQGILADELPEPGGWHFFVSGPPSFDQAMHDVLLKWGIDEGRIKMEQFLGY
jgi:glycine betaine catabolism B